MNAESAPRWPPTLRPSQLWVRQKEMAATIRIHHRHLLLLTPISDTYFTVPWRVEGWVDLGTAVRVYCPCPRLYIAVAVMIKNFPQWDSNLGPLTPQSGMLPLDPLVSVHDVFNRDEGVFLLSHVYDDLLLSAATTAATPSGELSTVVAETSLILGKYCVCFVV